MSLDQNRELVAKEILDKYLEPASNQFVEVVNEELCAKVRGNLPSKSRDLFAEAAK